MAGNGVKLSVAGFSSCSYFQKAANAAAALEHIFGQDTVTAEIVEFKDRDSYKAWLPQKHAELPASSKHTSSPLATVTYQGKDNFLGGWDDTKEFASKMFTGKVNLNDRFGQNTLPDLDDGATYDYDLVVIGGGSGGLACAKEACTLGAKVALLDYVKPTPNHNTKWGLGGTCVNVGCIPKKLMHQAALLGESMKDMDDFGWNGMDEEKLAHSWEDMVENVDNYICSLNFGYKVELRKRGVEYLNKLGTFKDPHTLECVGNDGSKSEITARRIVIAVGGRPRALTCPGAELAISSDDIFWKKDSPGKVCVVGASYIALECAGFLTAFKHDVTVLVRSIFLRGFDQDMANKIGDHMEKVGTKFIKSVVPEKLEKTEDGRIKVTWTGGDSDVFDTVLVAVGRDPDLKGLGLDKAGVKVGKNGKLETNQEQTNVPHIYAIGDVQDGHLELTPIAIESGKLLSRRLYEPSKEQMDYDNVCTTVFTPLEYSCCGLSEEDAREKYGGDLMVYHTSFTPLEWTVPNSREYNECYCKVLVNSTNDKVLGFHILAPNAGEIAQGYGIGMKLGMTFEDLNRLVGIHPTVAEELTLLSVTKESGENAEKSGC